MKRGGYGGYHPVAAAVPSTVTPVSIGPSCIGVRIALVPATAQNESHKTGRRFFLDAWAMRVHFARLDSRIEQRDRKMGQWDICRCLWVVMGGYLHWALHTSGAAQKVNPLEVHIHLPYSPESRSSSSSVPSSSEPLRLRYPRFGLVAKAVLVHRLFGFYTFSTATRP